MEASSTRRLPVFSSKAAWKIPLERILSRNEPRKVGPTMETLQAVLNLTKGLPWHTIHSGKVLGENGIWLFKQPCFLLHEWIDYIFESSFLILTT
jgi:hypothetical protein